MNMKSWLAQLTDQPIKKTLPILAFPGIQFMEGVTVRELVGSSMLQAQCLAQVAAHTDSAACVGFMDLSVEAEAFGAQTVFFEEDVPSVTGALVTSMEEAEALQIPQVSDHRTAIFLEGIRLARKSITDRPVFGGIIGPFSLVGRLVDVSEAMVNCYEEPEMMHVLLEKATAFLIEYANAFRQAGAQGVLMAEPLAGLIAPEHEAEFSAPYIRMITEAVQRDDFLVIYHNCGNYANLMTDSFAANGCAAYHFGNAVDMVQMLEKMPRHLPIMGNLDPAAQLRNGTVESVREATWKLMDACAKYPNFIPSSGCDVPPMSPWSNLQAFFDAVKQYYETERN